MTAPRSSMRALRQVQHTPAPASRRYLHITGVNSAQPANVADKASLYGARSVSDLKQECQRRTLANGGTKDEVCRFSSRLLRMVHVLIRYAARGTPLQPRRPAIPGL